jgi:periplasmic protein CpxP/Spy
MKSVRFRLLVAALVVTLGAALANAQSADATTTQPSHAHAWHHMRGPMGRYFAKSLNLTDEQRTQMKAVLQKEHATMKPLMQQLHSMQQQLKQYEEGTFDEAKVQTLVTAQAQTLVQLKVNETRIGNELYQILTPEQQSQLKEKEAQHEERMQQHMQGQAPEAPQQ